MAEQPRNNAPISVKSNATHASRLSQSTLGHLPENIRRPMFDRAALRCGILHLGCGNFHRAHQAYATQAAIEKEGVSGLRWGIASVSMRRREVADRLTAQDGLYTLLLRESDGTRAQIIGSIAEAVFAPEASPSIRRRLAHPQTSIVTLTVTANAYHLEPSSGRLDPVHPDILRDITDQTAPRTAIGMVTAGLEEVRRSGTRPPVVLCCDNMSSNGAALSQAVQDYASLCGDDALAQWIAGNVQFPDTMVDRIVPATTETDIEDAYRLLGGVTDEAPVSAEPWFQWTIADFDGPRPRWDAAGAKFVPDVTIFEVAKLRMLNGTHMMLAYLGALAGRETVAEAANDPVIGPLAERFMRDEQGSKVTFAPHDRIQYGTELMERFRNPSIEHRVGRIGRNGSAKFATRIIEPMRDNLEDGRSVKDATLLIAAWIRWFVLHERDDLNVAVEDPRTGMLSETCRAHARDYRAQAEAFLTMEEIFGPPLPFHDTLVTAIAGWLEKLDTMPAENVFRLALKA